MVGGKRRRRTPRGCRRRPRSRPPRDRRPHALRAQFTGTMAARSVSAEALRYLSAQRQVADAIRIAGIHRGSKELAIAVFGRSGIQELLAAFGWSRDDHVLDSAGKSFEAVGITEAEWANASTEPKGRSGAGGKSLC